MSEFNKLKPPKGYVPGVFRGAVAFTTRLDIGTAEQQKNIQSKPSFQIDEEESAWESIERNIERRKKKPNTQPKQSRISSIKEAFKDLKKDCNQISMDEWAAIPDVVDMTVKKETYNQWTPIPDKLIVERNLGAPETSAFDQSTSVNPEVYLGQLQKHRTDHDVENLDRARELFQSATKSNPKSAQNWISWAGVEEMAGKLAKARKIIKDGCKYCSKSPDVWMECARLHPPAEGKKILQKASQEIPGNEDIWLQRASMESNTKLKKQILKLALEKNNKAMKIWKVLIDLEEPEDAFMVMKHMSQLFPHAEEVWIALTKMETTVEQARQTIKQGININPRNPKLRICEAQLVELIKNHENIVEIVDDTMNNFPETFDYWMDIAYASENMKCLQTCEAIVRNILKKRLHKLGETGLKEERKRILLLDAEQAMKKHQLFTAESCYKVATELYTESIGIWKRYCEFLGAMSEEKDPDKNQSNGMNSAQSHANQNPFSVRHKGALRRALSHHNQCQYFWEKLIMLSDSQSERKQVIDEAKKRFPHPWIWLIEIEQMNDTQKQKELYKELKERMSQYPMIYLKYAKFERDQGNREIEFQILKEALEKHKKVPKLWLMLTQHVIELKKNVTIGNAMFEKGLQSNPNSILLWLCYAKTNALEGNLAKARAILEQARITNPNNEFIWILSVQMEMKFGSEASTHQTIARALQQCPQSGKLASLSLRMTKEAVKKARAVQIYSKFPKSPDVIIEIGVIFWLDAEYQLARSWFRLATQIAPHHGDAWIYFCAFEKRHGTQRTYNEAISWYLDADPTMGSLFNDKYKEYKDLRLTMEKAIENYNVIDRQIELSTSIYDTEPLNEMTS